MDKEQSINDGSRGFGNNSQESGPAFTRSGLASQLLLQGKRAERRMTEVRGVTVTVGIMCERWEAERAPGIGPMANPLASGVDHQAISWAQYGVKVGLGALLNELDRAGIRSTVFASGIIAAEEPDALRNVVRRGHELAAHGWAQNVIPATRSVQEEAGDVKRSFAALRPLVDGQPIGWISPRCTPSAETASLLAGEGALWFGDVFDTDLPYLMATPRGDICAIPFTTDVNDLPMTIRYGRPIEGLLDDLQAAVAARLTLEHDALLDLTVHAHLAGRPRGVATFRKALEFLGGTPGVRLRTKGEVALEFIEAGGKR